MCLNMEELAPWLISSFLDDIRSLLVSIASWESK